MRRGHLTLKLKCFLASCRLISHSCCPVLTYNLPL